MAAEGIHDDDETREPSRRLRRAPRPSGPMKAAVVQNAYPLVTATLVLLYGLFCAMAGPLAIAPGLLFFAVLWSAKSVRSGFRLDKPVELTVGAGGLEIDGKLRWPFDALREGFMVPDERGGPFLFLDPRRGRRLKLKMESARDGRELLRALGLAASQKAVTLRALCGPLTIGMDGLACSHSDGESAFIPLEDIATISTYVSPCAGSPGFTRSNVRAQRGVDLELHDGRSVRIPLTDEDGDPLPGLVEERIRECIDVAREAPEHEEDNDAIARRGRSGSEWLHGLRRSLDGGYRNAAVDSQDLARILVDPGARPSARAAAAIALASSGDAGAGAKLRIAAETIANPRVRVALESIASMEDDCAMAEALDVLDGAERRQSGR